MGRRMQFDAPAFNLNFNSVMTPKHSADNSNDDSDDDNSSVASNGSCIAIETHSSDIVNTQTLLVMPQT
jgi:hypothetical protein